jgi:hypothetical protein
MLPPTVARPLPDLAEPGALRFAADQLPWQRSLRWTRPVRDRRLLWLGGLLAVLVTVIELVGFGLGMRPYRHDRPPPQPIRVTLHEELPTEVPPPPPEPEPPIVVRPSRIAVTAPDVQTRPPPPRPVEDSDAMRARIGAGGAAAAPQLFNPDGSIRLDNPVVAPPRAPANQQEAAKKRWAKIEERGNPIDCKKTRFADAFAPDESAGDRVSRKYLKWVGLADPEAIAHRNRARAESGGCEPAE